MSQPLSPAAQAVKEAYANAWADPWGYLESAAVLRAAVNQVLPEMQPWHRTSERGTARHQARLDLLAIADELEAAV